MTFWIHKRLTTEYDMMALTLQRLQRERMPQRDRHILLRVMEALRNAKAQMVYGLR